MKVPYADRAVIAPEKLTDYLLNPAHRRGGPKARVLMALGYSAANWVRLETDLRAQHLTADVHESAPSEYGITYAVVALLQGPTGSGRLFRSVWQIDTGTDFPD